MSRTYRHKRPKMKLGYLSDHQRHDGKVRDGTPQYAAGSCSNHGGCQYCEGNRLHGSRKREPIVLDELIENIEDLSPEFSKIIDDNYWELV